MYKDRSKARDRLFAVLSRDNHSFPDFLILCLAIKVDSKGPIIFKQKRVGKDKGHFNIYKFRTMKVDTPKEMPTHLLENPDFFITKVGKFLRKTSLDELPQLLIF